MEIEADSTIMPALLPALAGARRLGSIGSRMTPCPAMVYDTQTRFAALEIENEYQLRTGEIGDGMLLGLKTLDGQEHWFGAPAATVPCFRCGLCCIGFLVKLSGKDINLLVRGLGISKADLLRKYVRKTPVGPVLRQSGDDCVFLVHEGRTITRCAAYAFRPEVCRSWVPSLFRQECQEGLRRAGKKGKVLLPGEMYLSGDDAARLYELIDGKPMRES